jgi:hypothetical protein
MEGIIEPFSYDDWLDEINEWFLSDVCSREDCENPLLGYPSTAIYCSDGCRYKARNQSQERKAFDKARRQTPEHKAYMTAYLKVYREKAKLEALASQ